MKAKIVKINADSVSVIVKCGKCADEFYTQSTPKWSNKPYHAHKQMCDKCGTENTIPAIRIETCI